MPLATINFGSKEELQKISEANQGILDYVFVRDTKGQLYLFTHGNEWGEAILNEYDDIIELVDQEAKEDVLVVCCYVDRMILGKTPMGYEVRSISENAEGELSHWLSINEKGFSYDLQIYNCNDEEFIKLKESNKKLLEQLV
jgi:hypothetical protein